MSTTTVDAPAGLTAAWASLVVPDDKLPTIQQIIAAVKAEVGPVGKSERNQQQNFNYRGIDNVVNAIAPAFDKYGVIPVPELLDAEHATVEVGKNRSVMGYTRVKVAYHFHGPRGDQITAIVPGEAMDSGDKAVSKAMSVAFRIALLQVLNLPTSEPDADNNSYERSSRQATAGEAFQGAIPADEYRAQQANGHAGNGNGNRPNGHEPQHQQRQQQATPPPSVLATLEDGDDWKARITEVTSSDEGNLVHAEIVALHKAGKIDDARRRQLESALKEHATALLTRHTRPDPETATDPVVAGQENPWASQPDFDPTNGETPPAGGKPGELEFASDFLAKLADCKTTDEFMAVQRAIGPALRDGVITPTTSAELMSDWRKAKDAAGATA